MAAIQKKTRDWEAASAGCCAAVVENRMACLGRSSEASIPGLGASGRVPRR